MSDFWGSLLRKARKNIVLKRNEHVKMVRYFRWSKLPYSAQRRDKEFYLRLKSCMRKARLGGPLRAKYKIKRFYGGMAKAEYGRLLRETRRLQRKDRIKKGEPRTFVDVFTGLLEKRSESSVFRMNLVNSVECAQALIKMGYSSVNGRIITKTRYTPSVGDVVSVVAERKGVIQAYPTERLKYNGVIASVPKYAEMHYGILSGVLLREPVLEEIPYLGEMHATAVSGAIV
jgi:ribosomal protein S4